MRKQRVALEDEADVAPICGYARHVPLADQDFAAARLLKAGDHAQRRGLAAARGPKERQELARLNHQIDIAHGSDRRTLRTAEGGGHAPQRDANRGCGAHEAVPTETR